MFTSAPPPLALRTGANALLTASVPKKFVSISARNSCTSPNDAIGAPRKMPALLITRSTSAHIFAAALTSSGLVTSSLTGTTLWTADASARPVDESMLPGSRAAAYTLLAPVTSATLPLMFICVSPDVMEVVYIYDAHHIIERNGSRLDARAGRRQGWHRVPRSTAVRDAVGLVQTHRHRRRQTRSQRQQRRRLTR